MYPSHSFNHHFTHHLPICSSNSAFSTAFHSQASSWLMISLDVCPPNSSNWIGVKLNPASLTFTIPLPTKSAVLQSQWFIKVQHSVFTSTSLSLHLPVSNQSSSTIGSLFINPSLLSSRQDTTGLVGLYATTCLSISSPALFLFSVFCTWEQALPIEASKTSWATGIRAYFSAKPLWNLVMFYLIHNFHEMFKVLEYSQANKATEL